MSTSVIPPSVPPKDGDGVGAGAGAGAGAGSGAHVHDDSSPSSSSAGASPTHDVVLFYKYVRIPDPAAFIDHLRKLSGPVSEGGLGLTGRVLVAAEGLNGTLSFRYTADGRRDGIDKFVEAMKANTEQGVDLSDVDWKRSTSDIEPFPELLFKNVKEIINTGSTNIPAPIAGSGVETGKHLSPTEFDAALKATPESEKVIIDVRCSKEYQIGHFKGATDPKIRTFAEYPKFVQENLETLKDKQVFMYCTGGIRCEKASAFMKSVGIKDCFQLRGGIHRYMEAFPDGGEWQGKNFVFDKRVAMAPTKAPTTDIVGRCLECQENGVDTPYDKFDPAVVCTVCRELVLVCPPCQEKLSSTYHCVDHRHLKDLYFTVIDHFTADQLTTQREGLEKLLGEEASKNKRKTYRKQMAKIDDRLAELAAGAVPASAPVYRCRTCSKPDCHGACWGFWMEPVEEGKASKRLRLK